MKLRPFLSTLIALPLALCALGSHSALAASQPRHGQGWAIQAVGTAVLAHSPDRAAFVLVSPLHLNSGAASAEVCARSIVPAFSGMPALKSYLSGAQITSLRQISLAPDTVVANVCFAVGGRAGKARLLCRLSGEDGQVVLIAAPQNQFPRYQKTLVRIAAMVSAYRAGGDGSESRTEGAASELRYRRWEDPREGAFTTEVPVGWRVEGGLIRRNALDPRQAVDMLSPDGQILVRAGDASVPGFMPPTPQLAAYGFPEGSVYSIGAGIQYIIAPFLPGGTFVASYLRQRITDPFSDFQVTSEKNRPDLTRLVQGLLDRTSGALVQYQASVGEVDFTCARDGKPMRGVCYGVTVLMRSGQFAVWGGFPLGYVAPPGKAAVASAALTHLVKTWRVSPAWIAQQSETAARVSRITAETNNAISKDIHEVYAYHTHVIDQTSKRFEEAILGRTTVMNPETGDVYTTEAGHTRYFLHSDKVYGSNSQWSPGIDFSPLIETDR